MINDLSNSLDSFLESSKNNNQKLYVILFKASWCNPCKKIYPFIEELSLNYPSVAFFKGEIDDDNIQEYTNFFQPKKVPSFFYFKNGTILESLIGTDLNKIEDLINKYL